MISPTLSAMRDLSGWGRRPVVRGVELLSEDLEEATREASATRGLGRSYGDASLPRRAGAVVAGTRLADRILRFDTASGMMRAEAGLSLERLERVALPHGFSCPVVPGTAQVTLGGMVACDVHGKNQHVAGCFGDHVRALRLRVADGTILEIGPSSEPELFRATLGGMGLTGHLLEVELQLARIPSPWILQEVERVRGVDAALDRLAASSRTWPFTVAWIDGLCRNAARAPGIVWRGRWAEAAEAPAEPPRPRRTLRVPCDAPGWLLGPATVGVFNRLYEGLAARARGPALVASWRFFFPLDALGAWNRLYGRRGFTQYQCVLPAAAPEMPRRLLDAAACGEVRSLLTVVKDFGRPGPGLLSFAMPGTTVALDLPLDGRRTQERVDAFNDLVAPAGGRVYLAKDLLTRPAHFRAMEPRLAEFERIRRRWDPEIRLATALSVRLFGDAP